MVEGRLPDEGPVQFGSVILPAGRLVRGNQPKQPVACATVDPVPGPGRIWAALSGLHSQTGLVPILLDGMRLDTLSPRDRHGLPGDALRPWDNGEFSRPQDPREADGLDAGALLGDRWRGWVPGAVSDCPEDRAARGPFTLRWPGLAAPERTPLTPAERQRALEVVLPRIRQAHRATAAARIGLVPVGRPADVLAVIGFADVSESAPREFSCTAQYDHSLRAFPV
jgi:hypothetical protein